MRIKEIVFDTLDAAVEAGLIPSYPPRVRPRSAPQNIGDVWSKTHLDSLALHDTSHPFYADSSSWENAFWLVEQFRGKPKRGKPEYAWRLPHCFGPFQSMPAGDALHHATAALSPRGFGRA